MKPQWKVTKHRKTFKEYLNNLHYLWVFPLAVLTAIFFPFDDNDNNINTQ